MVSLAFSIDCGVLAYNSIVNGFTQPKLSLEEIANHQVSAIIPTHNDGEGLYRSVESQMAQSHLARWVIIADDCSTDNTGDIGKALAQKYPNVIYDRGEKNLGKAGTINRIVEKYGKELGDYVMVNDGDTYIPPKFIETLLRNFTDEKIGAVTGGGTTTPAGNWIERELSCGKDYMFSIFAFRKLSQSWRGAIAVVNGSSTMYRLETLLEHPYRQITMAEDTDHTWLIQENGWKVKYDPSVKDDAIDVVGFKKMFTQSYRWFSGTWQTFYTHMGSKGAFKAPMMLYTNILPSYYDALTYGAAITAMPVMATLSLPGIDLVDPNLVVAGLAYDAVFTILPAFFLSRKSLKHLPGVYLYKAIATAAFISSGIKTAYQVLTHQKHKWSNKWKREQSASIRGHETNRVVIANESYNLNELLADTQPLRLKNPNRTLKNGIDNRSDLRGMHNDLVNACESIDDEVEG